MKKTVFFSVLLLMATTSIFAQSPSIQPPQIIPPSPIAQTFMRYGEIPVDYSTGVPNIDIPLYTLEGRSLKLPISISYHASGIKVNDIASEVGLGWALNCGGIVSKTTIGIRDEIRNGIRTYKNASEFQQGLVTQANLGRETSCSCMRGILDFEQYATSDLPYFQDPGSDRYFYRLPTGISGVFTYDYEHPNDIVLLPYRPIKIEKTINLDAVIQSFKITDDNGTIYTFGSYLSSQNNSEWFLNEISSADGQDKITYNYTPQTGGSSIPVSYHTYFGNVPGPYEFSGCYPENVQSSTISAVSPIPAFNTPILTSIVSSKAIISFTYSQDRTDFSFLKRLSDITIAPKDNPSATIKKVHFTPRYFGSTSTDLRLGLENVIINPTQSAQPQQYSFTYESQALPPYQGKTGGYGTFNEDYWGYYNGATNNTQLSADFLSSPGVAQGTSEASIYGANRHPDASGIYSKACMIKEIKYPTGGRTVFDFEPNAATSGVMAGGHRVKSITNYTGGGDVAGIKTYDYISGVTKPITRADFVYSQDYVDLREYPNEPYYGARRCWTHYTRTVMSSEPALPLQVASGMSIAYQQVVEYNGTKTNHSGKTVLEYNSPYSPSDFDSQPDHPFEYESPFSYSPYHYDKGNYVPELFSKKVYSFDGTTYHALSEERNSYINLFTKTFKTGVKVSRPKQFLDLGYFTIYCPTGYSCDVQPYINEYIQSFIAIDTKAYQEAPLLTNSKSYVYNPTDETKYALTETDYTYNEENGALKEKTTHSSKGDALTSTYKYPFNFASTAVYANMLSRNMVTPVVEQAAYKNTTQLLQASKTNYDFWKTSWATGSSNPTTSLIVPHTVEAKKGAGNYETRLRYDAYDAVGNPLVVLKEDDANTIYVWGYNKNYPIAQVTGSDYTTVNSLVNQTILDNSTCTEAQIREQQTSLRAGLAASKALVTTYIYKPLVGVTSQTDPTGKTTYYDYDALGRLAYIRDQNRSILKRYCYNYAGQSETCPAAGNIEKYYPYNRTNCPSGSGATGYYPVRPNTYMANTVEEANAMADADAAANGQTWVNENGPACEYGIPITFSNTPQVESFIEFHNLQTGQYYTFMLDGSSSGIIGYLPAGNYDVYGDTHYHGTHNFSFSCANTFYNTDEFYFSNVSISTSCHGFQIN